MRADDGHLDTHAEGLEGLGRRRHGGEVGVGPHDDTHQRREVSLGVGLTARDGEDLIELSGSLRGVLASHGEVAHLAPSLGGLLTVPVHVSAGNP